jgi:phosphoribosylaminoimidazole (AIR) synthetase
VPRVLPAGLTAVLDAGRWPFPPVFRWLAAAGGVADAEMARVFNCGLGMVAVVAADDVAEIEAVLTAGGERVFRAGRIVARQAGMPGCMVDGMESAWRA